MDRNATNRSDLAIREPQNPTPPSILDSKKDLHIVSSLYSPEKNPSFPPLRIQTQTNETTKKSDISPKTSSRDEKVLALMQQIRFLGKDQIVRRKEKKWEERHKTGLKKDGKDKEMSKEIMRITGWRSKRKADMEDGRGRTQSKRRKIEGRLYFLVWIVYILLFYTITCIYQQ